MLTIFHKLFGKSKAKAAPPILAVPLTPSAPMPTIEVAHLSLAAITARFSDELRTLLAREPEANATVALPMPTILKQLPAGCVKMSLGTLQRQAPGLIKPVPPGDKRTVDVPLAEIFRHLRSHTFKRRPDQLPVFVPESGFSLFGDSANPYAIAPDNRFEQTEVLDLTPVEDQPVAEASRGLKMDDGLRQHFGSAAMARSAASASELRLDVLPSAPHDIVAPVAQAAANPPATAVPPKPTGPTLALILAPLAEHWPDDIRAEVAALEPATTVVLPVNDVTAGLAKGRVTFSWAQIHAWLDPQPAPTQAAGTTALLLPLKIVAPAFLSAAKKPAADRKSVAVDLNIPDLFNNGRAPAPLPEVTAEASEELATETAPELVAPAAELLAPDAETGTQALPGTIGGIFGQRDKQDWTPAEIVAGTVGLPGVAGAIIALQEGLQVAASLPGGVKSEVVAAFLPQIFARLNQYSNEMKLGEVDDLLFTTHGAHCQIYRLGYVYLAVLGKPGESLPWHELRIISEELARQTHK